MGRRCYPDLPNHRLNTLCEHLKIELDHHRAGSDSRACAQLLLHYQACGMDIPAYYRDYDLTHFCAACPRRTGREEKKYAREYNDFERYIQVQTRIAQETRQ